MMSKLRVKAPQIFLADPPIAEIGTDAIADLIKAACDAPKSRARINMHMNDKDSLHEMIIALNQNSYIRPHKHPGKTESMYVVSGKTDIVFFDELGEIIKIVSLQSDITKGFFYYRLSEPIFHTLIIRSEHLVVHEVTNGPFRPDETIYANFAPVESNFSAVSTYLETLSRRVKCFMEAEK